MWSSLVPALDAIIDANGGGKDFERSVWELVAKIAAETRSAQGPKLTFIATSGTWVHGHNTTEVVSDTTSPGVLNAPVELSSWRPEHEQSVIKSTTLNGIVIRPAMVYGRSGSLLNYLFKPAYEGTVKWFGEPGQRISFVHQDDLAELYLLVAERAPILGGQIFDAANDSTEGMGDIIRKLIQLTGAKGPEYLTPTNGKQKTRSGY